MSGCRQNPKRPGQPRSTAQSTKKRPHSRSNWRNHREPRERYFFCQSSTSDTLFFEFAGHSFDCHWPAGMLPADPAVAKPFKVSEAIVKIFLDIIIRAGDGL